MGVAPARVLVVDDEPSTCLLIRRCLTDRGLDCRSVSDPARAQELLASRQFGLLITDIAMPQLSGLDLLVYAKRHAPGCRVILITGRSDREQLAQAVMLGAYDYLEKPFSEDDLVAAVRRATHDDSDISSLSLQAADALQSGSAARGASLGAVWALIRAVEAKDPYTRRHSEQVAHYAVHFAAAMGLTESQVESIRVASLLHDIGKIGVPDHILTKPGSLTHGEFEHIRQHPALGADILANITVFRHEAEVVRHHHERWDGKGYPDGLGGEESPLSSRIVMVADCVDAMLMERTYKRGLSVEKMQDELARCAGTQFDPRIAADASRWCGANPDKTVTPDRPLPSPAFGLTALLSPSA